MGKIGDLFVRLGLKSDGFKKGMQDAKKETQGFGNTLKNMKAGAVAVWAAIGAAVTKFAQDFLQATNRIGDAWAVTMSKVKAEYNTVLAEISTYKPDFSNFRNFFKNEWAWIKKTIFNAKEAGDAAVEMTKAFDAEFELTNSVRLQRQQIQQELNELYTKMRDTTLSPADRQAAADRYKALLQPIADAEVQIYGNMLNEAVKAWQAGNELDRVYSTQEMVEFFSKIGTEYDKMAAKFPDLMRVYETRKGDATNQPIFDIIGKYQQAANQMSDVDRILGRTTNSIRATIVRDLEAIAAAVKEYGQEDLKLDLDLDMEIGVDEVDMSEVDAYIEQFANDWNEKCLEIKELNDMLEQSFIDSFGGATQALTDALFGIEGAGIEKVMAALLQPFARAAMQLGEMLIAQGIGIAAFKESLKTLQPAVAIAAGSALVALGAALSSGIQALAGGGASSTSASVSAAGASAGTVESYEQDITIHVVGEISGDKIILVGQKTLNKWSR